MSEVFVTSDSHFNHANIIKYCGRNIYLAEADKQAYADNGNSWHSGDWKGHGSSSWRITNETVNNMNDALIENINKMVGEDDTLWHLGDFAFAPKHEYYRICKQFRDRIKCKNVYLIWGNHDRREIANLFSGCYDLYELRVGNQLIVLCHYCLAVFNKSHRGAFHFFGHSHSGLESWADLHMPGRRSMDVGVDNAFKILGDYRPFRYGELRDIMSKKTGFVADHHGQRTGPTEEELMG